MGVKNSGTHPRRCATPCYVDFSGAAPNGCLAHLNIQKMFENRAQSAFWGRSGNCLYKIQKGDFVEQSENTHVRIVSFTDPGH